MSDKVFKIMKQGHPFDTKICKYVPLHWEFDVKHDLWHKARLVMGGHVTDASNYDKCASTICMENIKLQLFLAARDKAECLGEDIGTEYLNSYTDEKYGVF